MGHSSRYDEIGVGYRRIRHPDPAIGGAIETALAGAERIVNVGAGTGSYEPAGRCIAAVEPSAVMIGQRSSALAPAVQATAEALPLSDGVADAALAVLTVMHWEDLARGLAELRRVAATSVIVTIDPDVVSQLWIMKDYAPEMIPTHVASLPSINDLAAVFPECRVTTVLVPRQCTDGFMAAFWGRPEAYLDPEIRRATSPWHQISVSAADRALSRLARDLADGSWDERYGHLRLAPAHDVGLRLLIGQ